MVRIIIILICFLVAGCSPRIRESISHTESHDTTTTYNDVDILIPERSDTFSLDMVEFCTEVLQANQTLTLINDSLQWALDYKPINHVGRWTDKPGKPVGSKVYSSKKNASVTLTHNEQGRVEAICHEEEWHARFDSLQKTVKIRAAYADKTTDIIYRCASAFHRMTVVVFWVVIGSVVLTAYLRVTHKIRF